MSSQLMLQLEQTQWVLSLHKGILGYHINGMPVECDTAFAMAGTRKPAQLLTQIQGDGIDEVFETFNPYTDGTLTDQKIEAIEMSCYSYEGVNLKRCERCGYFSDNTTDTPDGYTFCTEDCYSDLLIEAGLN